MHAGAFVVFDRLPSRDPDRILLRLNLKAVFLDAGTSTMATKSSPRWKMLIGGKLPMPLVLLPIQSLARRESSAF
jgi:hypothetical protein